MIKRNMSTEASRKFWDSFPKPKPGDKHRALPYLGDWDLNVEKELSFSMFECLCLEREQNE